MKEKHKTSMKVLGLTAIVSIFAFIGVLSNHADDWLGYSAAMFLISAWSCIQSIWWRVGEIHAGRLDENGKYVEKKAQRWMDFLHNLHLWTFFLGMVICALDLFLGT